MVNRLFCQKSKLALASEAVSAPQTLTKLTNFMIVQLRLTAQLSQLRNVLK